MRNIGREGSQRGALITDNNGEWFIQVNSSFYRVPMEALFDVFEKAHKEQESSATWER